MEKLLLVEHASDLRRKLKLELGREYAVLWGADRSDAMELFLQHSPKVVVLDLALPPDPEGDSEGMHCLEWIIDSRPATKVVVLTARDQRASAYRALGCGAYDYREKPVVAAELKVIVMRALHLFQVEEQSCQLKETLERAMAGIEGIPGQCVALRQLFSRGGVVFLPDSKLADSTSGMNDMGPPDAGQAASGRPGLPQVAGVRLPAGQLTLKEARDRVEKSMVSDAIGNCGGNMTRASELLGVSRPALYDLMKKYGLCRREPGSRF